MVRTWWPKSFRAATRRPRRTRPGRRPWDHGRRLVVESLECRALPSFLPAVNYPVGPPAAPITVAVGDLRGNGILDVVTDNITTNTVSVLLGNGDGTFQAPIAYGVDENSWQVVALGDVNGDGNLDIVVAGSTTTVLLGNGDGTFRPAITIGFGTALGQLADFKLADVNGDGKLDIVAVNSLGNQAVLSVALGNGDGTFHQPYAFNAPAFIPNSIAVGDLNGDGIPDVAIASSDTICDPETGDCENVGAVTIFLGTGDGFFQPPSFVNSVGAANSIGIGDVNGDGHLDLVTVVSSFDHRSSISVLLGNGDGTFRASVTTPAVQGPLGATVLADFNGDAILDVAAVNPTTNTVSVFLGNGDGTFQAPLNFSVDASPRALAVGDFNGDGFPDLVTANFVPSRDISVLLNDAVWNAGSSGAGGLRNEGAAELAVLPLPRAAEPVATAGLPWTSPPRPTLTAATIAVPLAEVISTARKEVHTQALALLDEELLSWSSLWPGEQP